MRGDGKGKFYRTLNLDRDGWESLKHFNKVKKEIIKEDKKKDKDKVTKWLTTELNKLNERG